MKLERLDEIKKLADAGEAGTKELVEIMADMFLSLNAHMKEVKSMIGSRDKSLADMGHKLAEIEKWAHSPIYKALIEDEADLSESHICARCAAVIDDDQLEPTEESA